MVKKDNKKTFKKILIVLVIAGIAIFVNFSYSPYIILGFIFFEEPPVALGMKSEEYFNIYYIEDFHLTTSEANQYAKENNITNKNNSAFFFHDEYYYLNFTIDGGWHILDSDNNIYNQMEDMIDYCAFIFEDKIYYVSASKYTRTMNILFNPFSSTSYYNIKFNTQVLLDKKSTVSEISMEDYLDVMHLYLSNI